MIDDSRRREEPGRGMEPCSRIEIEGGGRKPYKTLELRVGLTIFIAALVLVVGVMWFQGFKMGKNYYVIHAVFPMVGGVDRGDEVNINGVEGGEVKDVVLRDRDVLLTLKIDASVRIPVDSNVGLQTIGIMGERVVSIVLGESDKYFESGSVMEGVYEPGISDALASVGLVMADLRELAADMHEVAGLLTEDENLKNAIGNLYSLTEELKAVVSENAPGLKAGVSSFRESAESMDALLERNAPRFDSMAVSLDDVSRELPELLDRIGRVTGHLADIAERLQDEESTIGALLQDRSLLDRLEQAIVGLDELVTDIKANPKRYLKLEVF